MIPNSFTYRQILQIIIPGTFFTSMLIPVFADFYPYNFSDKFIFQKTVLVTVFSILFGTCIYAFEVPKQIWFFKKYLPTENIDKDERGKYFEFYRKDASGQKDIIDRYTGLFHLCINLSVASVILLAIYFIFYQCSIFKGAGFLILLILFLSIICSLLLIYGHQKLKYHFKKQVEDYMEEVNRSNI